MTDQTPGREQEIRARAEAEHLTPAPWKVEYEQCDCSDGLCRHGEYVTGVSTPDLTPVAAERLARSGEKPRDYDFHRSDIGDFSGDDWELMVHAREDIPWLLARVAELEADRDAAVAAAVRRALEDMAARLRRTPRDHRDYPAVLTGARHIEEYLRDSVASPACEQGEGQQTA
ncbi:hypothetical protein [Streptomyces sp. 8L]|uniref:hypothetical protein n=1 Tax=Streptomyces sp. 8L TaxID=2877242 RepID=UPI001CD4A7EE|nr:hypothetical protein [Streptomyces sp. 8L]MCA1224121.1 hypothetical protein [Streptomyces sp. 8L]